MYTHIHTYMHTYVHTYIHTFCFAERLARRCVLMKEPTLKNRLYLRTSVRKRSPEQLQVRRTFCASPTGPKRVKSQQIRKTPPEIAAIRLPSKPKERPPTPFPLSRGERERQL